MNVIWTSKFLQIKNDANCLKAGKNKIETKETILQFYTMFHNVLSIFNNDNVST